MEIGKSHPNSSTILVSLLKCWTPAKSMNISWQTLSHRQERNPCKTEKGGRRDAHSLHLGTWRGEAGQNVLMHISERGCLCREAHYSIMAATPTMYKHCPLEGIVSLFFLLASSGNNVWLHFFYQTRGGSFIVARLWECHCLGAVVTSNA